MDELHIDDLLTLRGIRQSLRSAVVADLRRRRRRRHRRLLALVAVLVGAAAISGIAAAGHWLYFQPAPPAVQKAFEQTRPGPADLPHRSTPRATPADAYFPDGTGVQVARFGDYTLYLLHKPQEDCFIPVDRTAPKEGPGSGYPEACGPPTEPSPGKVQTLGSEWGANPRGKTDPTYTTAFGSGYFFGYVDAPGAVSVELDVPGVQEPWKGSVDPATHYFVLGMSEPVWRALAPWDAWPGAQAGPARLTIDVTARDASGAVVGSGRAWWHT